MKLKNGEVYSAYLALDRLSAEKLPVRVSFGLAKLSVQLEPIFKVIEKTRIAALKLYGVENQGNYSIIGAAKENRDKFEAELDELFGQETDIGEFIKVKLPEMVAATCDKCHNNMDKSLEIEAKIMAALDKFVEV